jgi:glycosyltransferase involved in cell wall biosynthesis
MKNILIMCNVDPNTSPRPSRMIGWLKDKYRVTVVARQETRVEGLAASHVIKPAGLFGTLGGGKAAGQLLGSLLPRLLMWAKRDFEGLIWASMNEPNELRELLCRQDFDLIISHDCTLLPLAFAVKSNKRTRIMLDARDYYPRNFDDQFLWRIFIRPINEYLCQHYLPLCDKMTTVCDGLADEYHRVYGVKPEVVMNLPQAYDLVPEPVQPGRVRMIHHGSASLSRKLELMIEMMDYLDERFSLDLMLVGQGAYMKKICALARKRNNVRIIPPVPMPEIVPAINHYDAGLFLMPPRNFNLKYALPNKLFEYIQARLVVAISPSIEMKKVVDRYDCGVISSDFTPQSMARALNNLSNEKIMYLKEQSHKAAPELNADANRERIHQVVHELVSQG